MSMDNHDKNTTLSLVGVALKGPTGIPLILFEAGGSDGFRSIKTEAYEVDFLIRDFMGEGETTALAWISEFFRFRHPRHVHLIRNEEDEVIVQITWKKFLHQSRRFLRLGEGLALARRLSLPVTAHPSLFHNQDDVTATLAEENIFQNDFLYLSSLNTAALSSL